MNEKRPEYFGANGDGFAAQEERFGPPLGYVSEKLKQSVWFTHHLWHLAQRDIPKDLPLPVRAEETGYNVKEDSVLSPCYSSFRYSVTAFLALQNMLDIANQEKIFEKLLEMQPEEFERWLNRIEQEGNVHGK